MKRFPKSARQSSGFVLLIVIGVLAVLIIYLVAAQSTLQFSRLATRRVQDRLDRSEAATAIMALATAHATQGSSPTQSLEWNERLGAEFTVAPREANDPALEALAEVPPLAGDAVLTIHWTKSAALPARNRYLLNLEGHRAGAIMLAEPAEKKHTPSEASANKP